MEDNLAEIINLRMARKARKREAAQAEAQAARAKHGQTKHTRTTSAQEAARLARAVDGAKLDSANEGAD